MCYTQPAYTNLAHQINQATTKAFCMHLSKMTPAATTSRIPRDSPAAPASKQPTNRADMIGTWRQTAPWCGLGGSLDTRELIGADWNCTTG